MKNRSLFLLLGMAFILGLSAHAQTYSPDSLYTGAKGYIEYLPGTLPLIFAASHGGDLEPATIPDRSCPGCVTTTDLNTQELARQIRQALFERTGCYPHVVINRLKRTKLDANRDLAEAALGNPEAEQAWRDFHFFLEKAKAQIETAQAKRGLFIDLHGHGHSIQRLELGYLLSAASLRQSDVALNAPEIINQSSIRQLVIDNRQQQAHADLIRGAAGLGTLLEQEGYPSVPSLGDPAPKSGEAYFSGGYNTERHGSVTAEAKIDAIQIECNFQGVRDTEISREFFASALAKTLLAYLKEHYYESLPECRPTKTSAPDLHIGAFYPNPGCGVIQLDPGDQSLQGMQLEVFRADGKSQVRFPEVPQEILFSPAQFPNGVYWIVLYRSGRVVSRTAWVQNCP